MEKFEIREDFYLDGRKVKIISGGMHYFRVVPEYWRDRLEKLKALGCNTVETYIPWNLHEKEKGQFEFSGILDITRYVKTAQELGLMVILRPSPYICAEWEFGGLPYWLLKEDGMRLRCMYEPYLKHVREYYQELFKVIAPLQFTQGGPVIMMQVENEYGSFGNDKEYLRAIKRLMEENGAQVPLFTSDGAWDAALEAGSLIEDGVLATANFGSRSGENLDVLEAFFRRNGRRWPLMCMEFWDGWFNRWKEKIITRDPADLAMEVAELLKRASINLYMFQGGTNFGFYNGCSARGYTDLPQITSYNYDAILTGWREPAAIGECADTFLNCRDLC